THFVEYLIPLVDPLSTAPDRSAGLADEDDGHVSLTVVAPPLLVRPDDQTVVEHRPLPFRDGVQTLRHSSDLGGVVPIYSHHAVGICWSARGTRVSQLRTLAVPPQIHPPPGNPP